MNLKSILDKIRKSSVTEISQNSTLYHRSPTKYKVGDKIIPSKGSLYKEFDEIALEEYRKQKYPDRPARATAVYASVIPRSRFRGKGYLYTVKLGTGKWFMTNSKLIDIIKEDFYMKTRDYEYDRLKSYSPKELMYELDKFTADRYWKGTTLGDSESLEVVAEELIVTEVSSEVPQLKRGDAVKFKSNIPVTIEGYPKKSEWSKDKLQSIINKFITGTVQYEPTADDTTYRIKAKGNVKTNIKFYITNYSDPMYKYDKQARKEYNPTTSIQLSIYPPWDKKYEGRLPYLTLYISKDDSRQLIKV